MDTTVVKHWKQLDKPLSAKDIEIVTARFAKKADDARAFLKASPFPEKLRKK